MDNQTIKKTTPDVLGETLGTAIQASRDVEELKDQESSLTHRRMANERAAIKAWDAVYDLLVGLKKGDHYGLRESKLGHLLEKDTTT